MESTTCTPRRRSAEAGAKYQVKVGEDLGGGSAFLGQSKFLARGGVLWGWGWCGVGGRGGEAAILGAWKIWARVL